MDGFWRKVILLDSCKTNRPRGNKSISCHFAVTFVAIWALATVYARGEAPTDSAGSRYEISTLLSGALLQAPIEGQAGLIGEPTSITTDSTGDVFFISGSCVYKVDPSGHFTRVAGNGLHFYREEEEDPRIPGSGCGDGRAALRAPLKHPRGLAVNAAGTLYIAEPNRVRQVANGVITTAVGTGVVGFSGDGGPASAAALEEVKGVAMDRLNNLYVLDRDRIRQVNARGIITTIAGNGDRRFGINSYLKDGNPAANVSLGVPTCITVDNGGSVLFGNWRGVWRIENGAVRKVFGGGDSGEEGAFHDVRAIGVDSAGKLFVADLPERPTHRGYEEIRVREFANGRPVEVRIISGPQADRHDVYDHDNFGFLAVDSRGRLLLSDYSGGQILRRSGADWSVVAGEGSDNLATRRFVREGWMWTLAVDLDGTVYIAGGQDNHIYKLVNGTLTVMGTVGGNGTIQRIVAENGSVFVTTGSRIFRLTSNGVATAFAGCGEFGFDGDGGPAELACLSCYRAMCVRNGVLYFIDEQRIRKIENGIISTIAGTGVPGDLGNGGSAIAAQLADPEAIAVDGDGRVYIAEPEKHRVRCIVEGVIATVAGGGDSEKDGAPAARASLSNLAELFIDQQNSVLVRDGNLIRRIRDGVIATVMRLPPEAGLGPTSGTTVAMDPRGVLYVSLLGHWGQRLVKLTPQESTIVLGYDDQKGVVANRAGAYHNVETILDKPAMKNIEHVAVDRQGRIFFSTTNQVWVIERGIVKRFAGNGQVGDSGEGGEAVRAELPDVRGLAVDRSGTLFITSFSAIWRVTAGVLTMLEGSHIGHLKELAPEKMINPSGPIAIDNKGNVYFAEAYRVRLLASNVITTIPGLEFQYDRLREGVQFSGVQWALAVDDGGALYVADNVTRQLRKFSGGAVTTIGGKGTWGFSGDGGLATEAQTGMVTSLAVDDFRNIYLWDNWNSRVRKIVNGVITTIAGNGETGYTGDGGLASEAQLYGEELAINHVTGEVILQGQRAIRMLRVVQPKR